MGFLSKIFGTDLESEKRNKFQELESNSLFGSDTKLLKTAKIAWLVSRGNHLMQENKMNEAINDFREILEINPEEISAFECIIGAYSIKKDYTNANKVLLELKDMLNKSENEEIKVQSTMIPFYTGMLCLEIGANIKAVQFFYVFLKKAEEIANNPIWQKLLKNDESMKKDKQSMKNILQDTDVLDKSVSLGSAHEQRVRFAKDTLTRMKDELGLKDQELISQVL